MEAKKAGVLVVEEEIKQLNVDILKPKKDKMARKKKKRRSVYRKGRPFAKMTRGLVGLGVGLATYKVVTGAFK